jgi:hypothetical protein
MGAPALRGVESRYRVPTWLADGATRVATHYRAHDAEEGRDEEASRVTSGYEKQEEHGDETSERPKIIQPRTPMPTLLSRILSSKRCAETCYISTAPFAGAESWKVGKKIRFRKGGLGIPYLTGPWWGFSERQDRA